MRATKILLFVALLSGTIFAQTIGGSASTLRHGSSLPATCQANAGQVFLANSGTLYICSATNTWTAVSGGEAAGVESFNGLTGAVTYAPAWASISGKPSFAAVATSGAYGDLSGRPSLAAVTCGGTDKLTAYNPVTGSYTCNADQGSGDVINVSTQSGADICAKIDNAALSAVSAGKKHAFLDAQMYHGVQACASPFANWPWTPGQLPQISATILFSGDVVLSVGSRWQQPSQVWVKVPGGADGHFFGTSNYVGSWIVPANGYSDTVIVELGKVNASGGVPPQSVRLDGMNVSCQNLSGTASIAGSTGLLNQYAQERSGWSNTHISGCTTGFEIENAGILGGSINAGPYDNIHITMENVSDIATAGTGFKIGTNSTSTQQVGSIRNVWLSCTNTTGACPYAGYIDGHNIRFDGTLKLEQAQNGIKVGSAHNVQDVAISDLITVAGSSRPTGNALEIFGTVRALDAHVTANGTSYTTNMVADTAIGGKTITVTSQGTAPNNASIWYHRSMYDTVQTDAKGTASTIATMVDTSQSVGFTLSATADCGKTYAMGCSGACTVTLPASFPATTCEYTIVNTSGSASTPSVVTIARNGNSINGIAKDLELGFQQTAHIYPNASGTVWRAQLSGPTSVPYSPTCGASVVFAPWATVNSLTLCSTAVTSSTLAAAPDGFCTTLRIAQDGTGGRTFTFPTNVYGAAAVPSTASAVSEQRFCYNSSASRWDATATGSASSSSQPWGVHVGYDGNVPASQEWRFPIPNTTGFSTWTIPTNCAGSRLEAVSAATSTAVFSLQKCTGAGFTSCTEFGTATFAPGSKVATFSCTATTFVAGTDSFKEVSPPSADTTLAKVGGPVVGNRQ